MTENNTPLIYIIAGEASGDLLGARLMTALQNATGGNVRFTGVGGESMHRKGFESLFDNSELAVMGFFEVLPKVPHILGLINKTVKDIKQKQPDIVITIDSWSFSNRIHKRLKGVKFPHIHYVAPQVWAWRPKRAAKMKGKIDALLTLLPFENQYFIRYGIDTVCVGHPVVEGFAQDGNGKDFRMKQGIAPETPLLCLLPGSRHNEVHYLLPIFGETIKLLEQKIPNLQVVVPTVQAVMGKVAEASKTWDVPVIVAVGDKEKEEAFAAADIALAASGTVSLELAMAKLPQVIAYKLSPLTYQLAKRLLNIKYVNLINIMANALIVPECLQEDCTPEILAHQVEKLFKSKDTRLLQTSRARDILKKMGYGDAKTPSEKAADKVLSLLGKDMNGK
ncbi:MAG: lipid-A-disaccharide synthase [Alphaproteobacteria bacterium]|nr:lipid-A-disaccharide synthase [Alphaproteobacteria bacterium]